MDIGLEAIDYVRECLPVSEGNAALGKRGFEWWSGRLRQRVWTEDAAEDEGMTVWRLHCRTDLVKGFEGTEAQMAVLGELMDNVTLSALIRDPQDPGRLQLASSCYVNESTAGWMPWLFGLVTVWQNWEANQTVLSLQERLGLEVDASAPPNGGSTSTLHEKVALVAEGLAQVKSHPSRFAGKEMEGLKEVLNVPPVVTSTGDRSGFVYELPFCGQTSLSILATSEAHPQAGNGLSSSLKIPIEIRHGAAECLEMNEAELKDHSWTHFLGSWTLGDSGPVFKAFYPNLFFQPGILVAFALNNVTRARWIAEKVHGDNWEEGGFEKACLNKLAMLDALQAAASSTKKPGLLSRLFGRG
jgi:hypothetical protein